MDHTLLVDVESKIAEAIRLRKELATPVEEHDPVRSREGKRMLLRQVHEVTADLRLMADGTLAAGLPVGGKPGRALDDAYKVLGWELAEAFPSDELAGDPTKVELRIDKGLTPTVETDYERWQPLHWVLEAPDVMEERGGFDAVIGNPPFLGAKKISPAYGGEVRSWLVDVIASGQRGNADLVSYFFLRAESLVHKRSVIGLLATSTVAQGESRTVGIVPMLDRGMTIYRAIQSRPWPSRSASIDFAGVWATSIEPKDVLAELDGILVPAINSALEPVGRVQGLPVRLQSNLGYMFQGSIVLGKGFVLDSGEAIKLIDADAKNRIVVRPYLSGEDLTSRVDSTASRWVIDFGERSEDEARAFTAPWERVVARVQPERAAKDAKKYPRMVNEWWKHWNARPRLYSRAAELETVFAIARVAKYLLAVPTTGEQTFSDKIVVVTADDYGLLAVLSSSVHDVWTRTYSSTLGMGLNYSPNDAFLTFPIPEITDTLRSIGGNFARERARLCQASGKGLTDLYNSSSSCDDTSPFAAALRELQIELDEAVADAYGWEVNLGHGFYNVRQIPRFTIRPAARVEVLDKLLELNHQRARTEGQDVPSREVLS